MKNIPDQIVGGTLPPDPEFNGLKNEVQNAINATGIVLTEVDVEQLSKSITNHVANADFYLETGVADAYVANITGSLKAPTAYFNGMRVRFRASNTNTGASTLNVSALGIKSVTRADGVTALSAGDITITEDTQLIYDGTVFRLFSIGLLQANNFLGDLTGTAFGTFKRIFATTLTVATSLFNILSLDGDADLEYILRIDLIDDQGGSPHELRFQINGDLGPNYQRRDEIAGTQTVGQDSFSLGNITGSGTRTFSQTSILATTNLNTPRIMQTRGYGLFATDQFRGSLLGSGHWENLVSNVTALNIISSVSSGLGVGTRIELYARR